MLEINARPVRDLKNLIDRIGQVRVERELNVHRTTVKRWLNGQVKIPGHQHQVIKMLLGDLPGTAGKWTGWRFHDGQLVSPAGDAFDAGSVVVNTLDKSQLTLIAVALKVTATDGVCTADGMPSARLVIGPDT